LGNKSLLNDVYNLNNNFTKKLKTTTPTSSCTNIRINISLYKTELADVKTVFRM